MNESYILASQHLIHSEKHLHPDAFMLLYMLSLLIRTTLKQLKKSYSSFRSSTQTTWGVGILSFLLQVERAPCFSFASLGAQVTSQCDAFFFLRSVCPSRLKSSLKGWIDYLIYILVLSACCLAHGRPLILLNTVRNTKINNSYDIVLSSVSSVQSLSRVRLFVTPWTAACQASLSITNSRSLLKLMSIELVMPSNHLILCHPLLLLPSIFPSIRSFPMSQFFSSGAQRIGVSASASVLPMNTQDWLSLEWTGWISLQPKGLSRVFSNTTVQKHQFFGAQLSL